MTCLLDRSAGSPKGLGGFERLQDESRAAGADDCRMHDPYADVWWQHVPDFSNNQHSLPLTPILKEVSYETHTHRSRCERL